MTSRLQSVKFRDNVGIRDSLILSVDAVLRAYGAQVDLDALATALGGSASSASISGKPLVASTETQLQHNRVVEAARLWGLELRDLHPPEAAPLPTVPPEFEQHFRDSYMPFIRASLERDEPVLAWMGWPPPDQQEWGVITGIDKETGQCRGRTSSSSDCDQVMVGPAVQVYTVVLYLVQDGGTANAAE